MVIGEESAPGMIDHISGRVLDTPFGCLSRKVWWRRQCCVWWEVLALEVLSVSR